MMRRIGPCIGLLLVSILVGGCQSGTQTGNSIRYDGPSEVTVQMDEALPGTNIRYVGHGDDGAELMIGDQPAVKKIGDSLEWQGAPVPGVDVALSYRVLSANAQRLVMVGTVKVIVADPVAAAATFPDLPTYKYKVAVTYNVKPGATIPGTTISFVGRTVDGAQFSGVSGYPYRKLGDSIGYAGKLRDNTYIDTTLRVIAYTEGFVQVGGLVELGLTE